MEKKFKYHKIGEIQITPKKVKPVRGRPKKDEQLMMKYKIISELVADEAKNAYALELILTHKSKI